MNSKNVWAKIGHASRIFWVPATFIFVSLLSFPGMALSQQPDGVVTALKGQAQLTRAATQTALAFRDGVILRDIIDTRERSLVRILFGGKSTVTVRELTRLEVREELLPSGVTRSVHDLTSGAILINVARELLRPGDAVLIRTPNAIAAIRGSTMFGHYDPETGVSNFILLSGDGDVTASNQAPIPMQAKTSVTVASDPSNPTSDIQVTTSVVSQSEVINVEKQFEVKSIIADPESTEAGDTQVEEAAELGTAIVQAITGEEPTTSSATQNAALDTTSSADSGASSSNPGSPTGPPSSPPPPNTLPGGEPDGGDFSGLSKLILPGDNPLVVTGTLTQSAPGNIIVSPAGTNVTITDSLLEANNATITSATNGLLVGGSLKSTGTNPLFDIDPTTFTVNGSLVKILNSGTFELAGPLAQVLDSGSILKTVNQPAILVEGDGKLTATIANSDPFFLLRNSAVFESGKSFFDLRNSTFDLKGPIARLTGGSTLRNNSGPVFKLTGGSFTADTLVTTDGASNTFDLTGTLLDLTDTTFTLRKLGEFEEPDTDNASFNLAADEPQFKLTNSTLELTGTSDENELMFLGPDDFGAVFKGLALTATDSTLTLPQHLLDVEGVIESQSNSALVDLTNTTVNTNNHLMAVGEIENGPTELTLNGPILNGANITLTIGSEALSRNNVLRVQGSTTILTGLATGSLFTLNPSTLTIGRFFDNQNGAKTTLAGSLLNDTGSTFNVERDFVSVRQKDSSLTGTGTTALLNFLGSTVNVGTEGIGATGGDVGDFFRLDDSASGVTTGPSIVTLASPLVSDSGSDFDILLRFLRVEDGSTFTSTTTEPLIKFNGTTYSGGRAFTRVGDGSTLNLSGSLLSDSGSNSTFTLSNRFLRVSEDSTFNSTGTDSLLSFSGSTVNTGIEFLRLDDNSSMSLKGPLAEVAANSTFTVGDDRNADFLDIRDSSQLTGPAKPASGDAPALVTFNQSTFRTDTPVAISSTRFLDLRLDGELTLGGPLLEATASTFNSNGDFARVTQEGVLTGEGTTALFQFINSTFNIGDDTVQTNGQEPNDSFFRIDDSSSTTVTGPATVNLKGALVNDSGSTFNVVDRFLEVRDGAALESTTSAEFIKFSDSTVNVMDDFVRIDDNAKVTLSSSLLKAGSTLNIGTDSTASGDLVDILEGQLVMNSTDPVVLFAGGTHTVGTSSDTNNKRLFRLEGGFDLDEPDIPERPIKGIAANSFTVNSETASFPIGTLLKATDGSDGAKITVENGNAIRFDFALYEATLPIIDLFTSASATRNTEIITSGSSNGFIDMTFSKLIVKGPIIALDNSLITVNDGPLLNLRNGSTMTVGSPLLKLLNKSQINVFNGPAIKVDGAGTALTVNGAFAEFGGSGNNTIIIKNDIISNASRGGSANNQFPVRITEAGAGTSITIGANPITNPGLGSITISEKTTGSGGGVLIQASNGGTVNITAP